MIATFENSGPPSAFRDGGLPMAALVCGQHENQESRRFASIMDREIIIVQLRDSSGRDYHYNGYLWS